MSVIDWPGLKPRTSREESPLYNGRTVMMAAAARRFSTIVNTITACKNGAGVHVSTAQSPKWKISMRQVVTGLCIAVGGIAVCQKCRVKEAHTTRMSHPLPVVFAREKVRFTKSLQCCVYLLHIALYKLMIV